jgi:hypothetical protein
MVVYCGRVVNMLTHGGILTERGSSKGKKCNYPLLFLIIIFTNLSQQQMTMFVKKFRKFFTKSP